MRFNIGNKPNGAYNSNASSVAQSRGATGKFENKYWETLSVRNARSDESFLQPSGHHPGPRIATKRVPYDPTATSLKERIAGVSAGALPQTLVGLAALSLASYGARDGGHRQDFSTSVAPPTGVRHARITADNSSTKRIE